MVFPYLINVSKQNFNEQFQVTIEFVGKNLVYTDVYGIILLLRCTIALVLSSVWFNMCCTANVCTDKLS